MPELVDCACRSGHPDGVCRVSPQMTGEEIIADMAQTFKCLSDPSRLRIINALLISEMCVHTISRVVGMSQPAVSHHLKQLRQLRLVKCRRKGRAIFYSLSDYHIQLLFDLSKTHVCEPRETIEKQAPPREGN